MRGGWLVNHMPTLRYTDIELGLENLRWHRQHGTKLLVQENVVTGSIHQLASRCLTATSEYVIRTVHTSPQDTGHGAIKRFRGWRLDIESLLT